MKLSFILFVLSLNVVFASHSYAQKTFLSIDLNNRTVADVLDAIEHQSEFRFYYNSKLVDTKQKVSVNVNNADVFAVLNQLFAATNIGYKVVDKDVILIERDVDNSSPQMAVFQQGIPITGTITDNAGEPMPGVNVLVKGTVSGTVTDINGKYTIHVPNNDAVLMFSFIGYITNEFPVGNQRQINIVLEEDTHEIEEVVVVGYGTQKKVNVIGSVSQVAGEKLENRTVPLLSNALAGQMTGVTVIQRSGTPGDSPGEIRIRGVGSIAATPDALVLVDGVPGSINDVRPEDVASISVLKDAATAAIYGARGANGVILITTKMGGDGKLKVSYNGYVGFTKPTEFPDMVNSWEYAAMYNDAMNANTYDVDAYKNSTNSDLYPNSNFLKDVFSRNGFQTGHDISLNGGNKSTQYYLTFGYLDQNGVVEKNNYTRYDMRLNLVTQLASRLKLSTWLSGISSKIEEPAIPGGREVDRMNGIVTIAVRYPAIYAGRMSNGDYGTGPEQTGTPVAWMDSPSFYEAPTFKVTGRLRLDYNPIDDLKLSVVGGYNNTGANTKIYRSTMRLNDTRTMGPSYLNEKQMRTVYGTLQALAEYNKTFGQHDIDVLAGYSFETNTYREFEASRDNFPVDDLPYLNVGSQDNQKNAGGGNDWTIQSVFGRFKYSYAHKYLAEATIRYDGSSRFPESYKYGTFPSMALGWRISEEDFFKDNISWIYNLKLKASIGKLGNNNIGNYPYQNTYALTAGYVIGDNVQQGGYIASLKDPTLHWESTRTTDGGVEIGLFKNGLLDISASYFYRKTTDCLYKPSANVSTVLGMSVDYANTGSLKNTGWEFEASHRNQVGDFTYSVSGNLSIIKNELISLGLGNVTQRNGMVGNGSDLFVGYPMQAYYGYKTDGMFLDQNDIDNYPDQSRIASAVVKPGDLRYVDIMAGEGEAKAQVDPNYDRVYLGSRIPKYTYSFNLSAGYKGIDLSAQFYGVAGVKGRLEDFASYALFSMGNVQRWQMDGRWDPANPQRYNDYPRMEVLASAASRNTQLSDFWVLNASYFRLKNLQVGYTIPKSLTDKVKISSLRFYINMENVFSINAYRKGWDPEINTGGGYYPILATYTFGANLRF